MAFVKYAEYRVPAGGVASVVFSGIPLTGKDLLITASARTTAPTGTWDSLNISTPTSSTVLYLYGNGGTPLSGLESDVVGISFGGQKITTTSNSFASGKAYFANYISNTNKVVLSEGVIGSDTSAGGLIFSIGRWQNTSPISSLTLVPSSGSNFVENSVIAVYIIS